MAESISYQNRERIEYRGYSGADKIYAKIYSGRLSYENKKLYYSIKIPYFENEEWEEINSFHEKMCENLLGYLDKRIKRSENDIEYAFFDFIKEDDHFLFSFSDGKFEDRENKKKFMLEISESKEFHKYKKGILDKKHP